MKILTWFYQKPEGNLWDQDLVSLIIAKTTAIADTVNQ